MIRLVTQFDEPEAQAAVSTPSTEGCCCCCCCCIASTVSTSTFTALNLRGTARTNALSPARTTSLTVLGALSMAVIPFAAPITAGGSACLTFWYLRQRRGLAAAVAGALGVLSLVVIPFAARALPITGGGRAFLAVLGAAIPLTAWGLALFGLYTVARHRHPIRMAVLIAVAGGALFALEGLGGVYFLLKVGIAAVPIYLGLAIGLIVTSVLAARKLNAGLRRSVEATEPPHGS